MDTRLCETGGMLRTLGLDHDAVRRIAERHGVARLAVFGSMASGNFNEHSDIDFLVDFLPGRQDPFQDFCGLKEDLAEITNKPVDLVVARAIRNPYFLKSVQSSLKSLYVR